MLSIFIFLLSWTLVHSSDTPETCPSIPFLSVINFQCPTFQDLRCVRFMTKSKIGPHTINCALMEPNKNPEMTIVNASQLINILQEKDDFGRPICSIVMFYSPNCVFSKRVAGYVYLLAKLFPQLQVYAINIHKRSPLLDQMINQHGIAATPIVFLFENKIAKIRLYDESSSLRSLAEIILSRTDLKLPTGIKPKDLSTYGYKNEDLRQEYGQFISQFFDFEEPSTGIDRYFIGALIILLLNMAYFLHFSSRIQQLWQNR